MTGPTRRHRVGPGVRRALVLGVLAAGMVWMSAASASAAEGRPNGPTLDVLGLGVGDLIQDVGNAVGDLVDDTLEVVLPPSEGSEPDTAEDQPKPPSPPASKAPAPAAPSPDQPRSPAGSDAAKPASPAPATGSTSSQGAGHSTGSDDLPGQDDDAMQPNGSARLAPDTAASDASPSGELRQSGPAPARDGATDASPSPDVGSAPGESDGSERAPTTADADAPDAILGPDDTARTADADRPDAHEDRNAQDEEHVRDDVTGGEPTPGTPAKSGGLGRLVSPLHPLVTPVTGTLEPVTGRLERVRDPLLLPGGDALSAVASGSGALAALDDLVDGLITPLADGIDDVVGGPLAPVTGLLDRSLAPVGRLTGSVLDPFGRLLLDPVIDRVVEPVLGTVVSGLVDPILGTVRPAPAVPPGQVPGAPPVGDVPMPTPPGEAVEQVDLVGVVPDESNIGARMFEGGAGFAAAGATPPVGAQSDQGPADRQEATAEDVVRSTPRTPETVQTLGAALPPDAGVSPAPVPVEGSAASPPTDATTSAPVPPPAATGGQGFAVTAPGNASDPAPSMFAFLTSVVDPHHDTGRIMCAATVDLCSDHTGEPEVSPG